MGLGSVGDLFAFLDSVRGMDPAQGRGPIALDQDNMGRQVQQWIQKEAQRHGPEGRVEEEMTITENTAPAEELAENRKERSKRIRAKPSWLKEFVRMERS